MSRSKWKSPFLNLNLLKKLKNNKKEIFTHARNSVILKDFVGLTFHIYQGCKYNKILITNNMVGHKLGEFSFTRKVGNIHKVINKKNKKKNKIWDMLLIQFLLV